VPPAKLYSKWRALCAAGVAAVLALTVAACGGTPTAAEEADLVNGKELFVGEGTCGSCHALARAGTTGTQGPNLDAAFANAREEGMGESVIEGVVHEQIKFPRRSSIMMPDLVTGQDARDVAAYVAHAAAKPGEDTGLLASVGAVDNSNKLVKAENGQLVIPADPSGALAFEFGKAEAPAGRLVFEMPNPAPIPHNIALEQPSIEGDVVNEGGTSTFTATLDAGEYTYLCTVPGHAEGGMVGTLTVK
jgi:mono/diheme cytochrome c family protein